MEKKTRKNVVIKFSRTENDKNTEVKKKVKQRFVIYDSATRQYLR